MSGRTSEIGTAHVPWARWAVPLAFFAATSAFATYHSDPVNSAEAAFLGLLASVIACCLAGLDRPPYRVLTGCALLTSLAIWGLPAGAARGATVSILLLGSTAAGIHARFARGVDHDLPRSAIAIAVAAQALFRPEIWLAPTWEVSMVLEAIVFPVVAGLATASVVARRGERWFWGAALAVALARGIGPELTLLLAIAAATVEARERKLTAAIWTVTAIALLVAALPEVTSNAARQNLVTGLSWVPLLVPSILRPAKGRSGQALLAVAAALAGLWFLPAASALGIAMLLAFDALPVASFAWRLQRAWSIAVVLGAAVVSAYPWLRPEPATSALALAKLQPGWLAAALVGLAFWGLVALERLLHKAGPADRRRRWALAPAKLVLLGSIALASLPPFHALLDEPFVLSQAAPVREIATDRRITEIFLDSYVSNGIQIDAGESLGTLALQTSDGTSVEFDLSAGTDTGEWAANRPDISVVAPRAWISWLAPDGPYFAQRYRTRRELDSAIDVIGVRLSRSASLPPEVALAVFQIGGRE